MALFLDVGTDDVLRIDNSYVTLERKSGTRARLRIISQAEVELMRNAKTQATASAPQRNPVRQSDEE